MADISYPVRTKETTSTTGNGTITLGGAVSGFNTFSAGVPDGNYVRYTIEDSNGSWEVGTGKFDYATNTLTRNVIKSSAFANFKIQLSGDAEVYATTTNFETSTKQLLMTQTANNSSYIANTWLAGTNRQAGTVGFLPFTKLEIEIDRLTPVNNGFIYLRLYLASGTTTNSIHTYYYRQQIMESYSSTDYAVRMDYSSVIYLGRYQNVGGSTFQKQGFSGTITIPLVHDQYQLQYSPVDIKGGYIDTNGYPITHQSFTYVGGSLNPINGIYLFSSGGNLSSGRVSYYGIRDI